MSTESRLSRLEGAYEQVNERLADHVERFADISRRIEGVREEIAALRGEMNANIAGLRSEMNASNASLRAEIANVRRESRWIGGIIIAGLVITVISVIVTGL